MSQYVLEIRLIGGEHAGKKAFIPRITISPSAEQIAFEMKRRQFPVRLAFAMTINKSQGQSVDNIGLDLRTDVFAHGQLYVALSRCTSSQRVKALFKNDISTATKNIVYPEVLLD
jgi:ATP-dependent exoDNAse (exonuclease V) alpha subunit